MKRSLIAANVAALIAAILPTGAAGQIYLAPDATERAAKLTPEQIREALERAAEYDRQSDMGQCRPMDGEEQRFAASEALPEMELALGASLADLAARFPVYFQHDSALDTTSFSAQKMRLSINLGGETIRMTTGGMHNLVTVINATYHSRQIYSLSVYHQQCALRISVALERATALEEQLQRAGFTSREGHPRLLAAEEFGRSGRREMPLANWLEAQEQMIIAPRIFSSVRSVWTRGPQEAHVIVHNWGGAPNPEGAARMGPIAEQSVFERDGTGRKYGVELSLRHLTLFDEDFDAHAGMVETGP